MAKEKRFAGRLSEEYRLVQQAYPHFKELQHAVGDAVAAYEPGSEVAPALVLELGCGDGITTERILCSRSGLRVVAIDNEEEMVRRARENLVDWISTGDLSVVHGDAVAYLEAAADGSVDVVASAMTLHNFLRTDRDLVLSEIFRALKPGGLFINADKYAPEGQARFDALGKQLERFFDAFLPLGKTELLKDWVLHNVADQSPDRVMTETRAREEMTRLGFANVQVGHRHNMEAMLTATKPRMS